MFLTQIVSDYFVWHYTRAWVGLFQLWRQGYWFVVHYFSLVQLLRNLFAPFKRMTEGRKGLLDGEAWIEYIVMALMTRFIGFLVRFFIILLCLVALALVTVIGGGVVLIWGALPLMIAGLWLTAITLFFV